MKILKRWSLMGVLYAMPYLLVLVAGWFWLFQNGYLLYWILAAGVIMAIAFGMNRWLIQYRPHRNQSEVVGSNRWPLAGERAWAKVLALSDKIAAEKDPVYSPERWWEILRTVLETVSREFHPDSKRAELEIPVPHVLKVVELVAMDLRRDLSANVPGAHMLTMHDAWRLKGYVEKGQEVYGQFYNIYRLGHLFVNPVAAFVREVKDHMAGELLSNWGTDAQRWVVDYCVKKAGYHAIELYSGNVVLDDKPRDDYQTPATRRDADKMAAREEVQTEPLRIMVLGQVKAGKSSLINALFGEMKAGVDVIPTTKHIEPYLLERDGVGRAFILDTAGYADSGHTRGVLEPIREEILKTDLFLIVCSATSAARATDRDRLNEVREIYSRDTSRHRPVILAVLTHIDLLRPLREWKPPYNLSDPAPQTKARQISDAVLAVAADLELLPEQVIPVCMSPELPPYNVEEGLVPAIVEALPAADRARYLRSLANYRDEEYWRMARQQALAAGRLIAGVAKQAVANLRESFKAGAAGK